MAGVRVSMNRGEEKPLLVSIVDGKRSGSGTGKGSDDETYIDHKYGRPINTFKKWQYDNKNGNGRSKHMMMGAVNVVNKWPDHLAMCWMIAVAICMVIIVGVLMLENTFRNNSPQQFSIMSLQQQCKLLHNNQETPDKTNVYLHIILNDNESFNIDKYNSVFNGIKEDHPKHIINLILLHNDTIEGSYRRNTRFKDWELFHNQLDQPKFFSTASMEGNPVLINKKDEDLKYTNVKLIRSTFSMYFRHSPLRYRWKIMAPEMMPFILRLLTIWDKGGITMPWQLFIDKTEMYNLNKSGREKIQEFMNDLKKVYAPDDKLETEDLKAKKQLIEDIKHFVDTGINVDLNDSYASESDYSEYSEESVSEKPMAKPTVKVKPVLNNAMENLGEVTQKMRLPGVNSASFFEADTLSRATDSRITIKNRKDKERVFVPEHQLVKTVDPEVHIPSDSDAIDREIKKALKNPVVKMGDAAKKLDQDYLEELDQQHGKRVKRDINAKQKELEYRPRSPSEYLMSDYNYDFESDPYSGLNAQEPFKTNRGKKKEVNAELDWSDSKYEPSRSSEEPINTLDGLTSSASEESSDISRDYFMESQAYVYHNVFDNVNVFSLPSRTNLEMDKFGYYFATKRPCHAYLGIIISNLQSSYDLTDPDTAINDGLKSFCKGSKFNDCVGLSLL